MSEARDALWATLAGWGDGYVLFDRADGEPVYVPTADRRGFSRALDTHSPCRVSACPRRDRAFLPVTVSGAVWVSVESGRSLGRLRDFWARPTFVFDAGGSVRRVALWALERPLRGPLYEANRRLAHALGAPKKHAEVHFSFDPASLVYARLDLWDPMALLGRLPAPPDPHAWRRRR